MVYTMGWLWMFCLLMIFVSYCSAIVPCPVHCKCRAVYWQCSDPRNTVWPLDNMPGVVVKGIRMLDLSGSGVDVLPNHRPTHNFPDLKVLVLSDTVFDGIPSRCRELECLQQLNLKVKSKCGAHLRRGCSYPPCCSWSDPDPVTMERMTTVLHSEYRKTTTVLTGSPYSIGSTTQVPFLIPEGSGKSVDEPDGQNRHTEIHPPVLVSDFAVTDVIAEATTPFSQLTESAQVADDRRGDAVHSVTYQKVETSSSESLREKVNVDVASDAVTTQIYGDRESALETYRASIQSTAAFVTQIVNRDELVELAEFVPKKPILIWHELKTLPPTSASPLPRTSTKSRETIKGRLVHTNRMQLTAKPTAGYVQDFLTQPFSTTTIRNVVWSAAKVNPTFLPMVSTMSATLDLLTVPGSVTYHLNSTAKELTRLVPKVNPTSSAIRAKNTTFSSITVPASIATTRVQATAVSFEVKMYTTLSSGTRKSKVIESKITGDKNRVGGTMEPKKANVSSDSVTPISTKTITPVPSTVTLKNTTLSATTMAPVTTATQAQAATTKSELVPDILGNETEDVLVWYSPEMLTAAWFQAGLMDNVTLSVYLSAENSTAINSLVDTAMSGTRYTQLLEIANLSFYCPVCPLCPSCFIADRDLSDFRLSVNDIAGIAVGMIILAVLLGIVLIVKCPPTRDSAARSVDRIRRSLSRHRRHQSGDDTHDVSPTSPKDAESSRSRLGQRSRTVDLTRSPTVDLTRSPTVDLTTSPTNSTGNNQPVQNEGSPVVSEHAENSFRESQLSIVNENYSLGTRLRDNICNRMHNNGEAGDELMRVVNENSPAALLDAWDTADQNHRSLSTAFSGADRQGDYHTHLLRMSNIRAEAALNRCQDKPVEGGRRLLFDHSSTAEHSILSESIEQLTMFGSGFSLINGESTLDDASDMSLSVHDSPERRLSCSASGEVVNHNILASGRLDEHGSLDNISDAKHINVQSGVQHEESTSGVGSERAEHEHSSVHAYEDVNVRSDFHVASTESTSGASSERSPSSDHGHDRCAHSSSAEQAMNGDTLMTEENGLDSPPLDGLSELASLSTQLSAIFHNGGEKETLHVPGADPDGTPLSTDDSKSPDHISRPPAWKVRQPKGRMQRVE